MSLLLWFQFPTCKYVSRSLLCFTDVIWPPFFILARDTYYCPGLPVILLKYETNRVMPLMKIIKWVPINVSVKAKFHSRTSKTVNYLLLSNPHHLSELISWYSLPCSLSSGHASILIIFRTHQATITLGPQHLLSLYLESSFPKQAQGQFSHCL